MRTLLLFLTIIGMAMLGNGVETHGKMGDSACDGPCEFSEHCEETEKKCKCGDGASCEDTEKPICLSGQCKNVQEACKLDGNLCDQRCDLTGLDEYRCYDGHKCIKMSQLCDGIEDCDDGDDEIDYCGEDKTHHQCKKDEFRCSDGKQCIKEVKHCDGGKDCDDGSDEMSDCVYAKHEDDFRCEDEKKWIKMTKVCDGHPDCADSSDETLDIHCGVEIHGYEGDSACGACQFSEHCEDTQRKCKCGAGDSCEGTDKPICLSGQCKNVQEACKLDGNLCDMRCDTTGLDEYRCSDGHKCIKMKQVCDGIEDCDDGDDEMDHCADGMAESMTDVTTAGCTKGPVAIGITALLMMAIVLY